MPDAAGQPDTRAVWTDSAFRDYIDHLGDDAAERKDWVAAEMLHGFVLAWDAAPANPAEVVRSAMNPYGHPKDPYAHLVPAVLAALGYLYPENVIE